MSTNEQGESGAGLAAQEAAIRAEATRRGWDLTRVLVDVGSGRSLDKRPNLAAALTAMEPGAALVVAKLDRLSRSLVDFAAIMARAQREGWSVVALDIGVDTSTINGELVASIIMALAQWERRVIGARTKDALGAVRARGTRLGRPVGTDEDTESLIRLLREQGEGWRAIAARLNDARVPTTQGGARWYGSTVRAIWTRLQSAAAPVVVAGQH